MMRGLLAILLVLGSGGAWAQTGDVAEGRRLAEMWCANCHRVAPEGPGPVADAVASFMEIAARPGVTQEGIATFLRVPHATMPDHGLTLQNARDIAAYLLTQKPR